MLPLPVWMRDRWRWRRRGRVLALVRAELVDWLDEEGLWRAPSVPPAELAREGGGRARAGGRGAVALLPAGPLGEAVLRRYRRGGLPGRLVRHRYLLGDRAFRETVLTERLWRAGLPAPEPLAALQERRGAGYTAALLTRRVPAAVSLSTLLRERAGGEGPGEGTAGDGPPSRRDGGGESGDAGGGGPGDAGGGGPGEAGGGGPGDAADWMRRTGAALGRLHAAGAWHADASAGNFLLDPAGRGEAVVVDWDRGRLLPEPLPGPLATLNLRRLRRSLKKLGAAAALGAWPALEEAHARSMNRGGTGSENHRCSPPR